MSAKYDRNVSPVDGGEKVVSSTNITDYVGREARDYKGACGSVKCFCLDQSNHPGQSRETILLNNQIPA